MTNLQAAAMTEARRKALEAINASIRSEGRRPSDFRISERARAAAAMVANDPKWLEAATVNVERWILAGVFGKTECAKFKTSARKRRR